jgi:hypothetical protein
MPEYLATGTPAGEGILRKVRAPTCQNQLCENVLISPLTVGQRDNVSSRRSVSNSIEIRRFTIHPSLFVCAMSTISIFAPELPKFVTKARSDPSDRVNCATTKGGEAKRRNRRTKRGAFILPSLQRLRCEAVRSSFGGSPVGRKEIGPSARRLGKACAGKAGNGGSGMDLNLVQTYRAPSQKSIRETFLIATRKITRADCCASAEVRLLYSFSEMMQVPETRNVTKLLENCKKTRMPAAGGPAG